MSAKHIAIIDYGMGNLHSVSSALRHVAPEVEVCIATTPEQIERADHIVFPGVGAIRDCLAEIRRHAFDEIVSRVKAQGKPLLAICVGMQSLMESSDENDGVDCLGILSGRVRFFSDTPQFCAPGVTRLKVPHMGWNQVEQTLTHPLWKNIPQQSRFYFVHSYYVESATSSLIAGQTNYGITFSSVLAQENLFAVQFHPEKSHTHGLQLLRNFVDWDGEYVVEEKQ